MTPISARYHRGQSLGLAAGMFHNTPRLMFRWWDLFLAA